MRVRFLQNGVSPDFGEFKKDGDMLLPATVGTVLIARGLAEEVKSKKTKEVKGDAE